MLYGRIPAKAGSEGGSPDKQSGAYAFVRVRETNCHGGLGPPPQAGRLVGVLRTGFKPRKRRAGQAGDSFLISGGSLATQFNIRVLSPASRPSVSQTFGPRVPASRSGSVAAIWWAIVVGVCHRRRLGPCRLFSAFHGILSFPQISPNVGPPGWAINEIGPKRFWNRCSC